MRRLIVAKSVSIALFCCSFFASCSDSDNVASGIEPVVTDNKITAEMRGGYYDVQLVGEGSWTASAVGDDDDWLTVNTPEGNGSGSIELFVEPNYSGIDRSAELQIISGEKKTSLKILQEATLDGHAPGNDENVFNFIDAVYNKGLGCGYNVLKGKAASSIVNRKPLKFLLESDEIYDELYTEANYGHDSIYVNTLDSIESKKDSLGVKASIEIAYSIFKLGISGAYEMGEDRKTKNVENHLSAKIPVLKAKMDLGNIMTLPDKEFEDKKLSEKSQNIISSCFKKKRDALVEYCKDKETVDLKDATLKELCRDIVDNYGHAITVETTLGGLFYMNYAYDSIQCKEYLGVKEAKVSVQVGDSSSVLSKGFYVGVDVEASYQKSAEEFLKTLAIGIQILGGEVKARNALTSAYQNYKDKYGEINDLINKWVATIDKDYAEVVSMELRPIWVLIDNVKAKEALRQYVLSVVTADKDKMGVFASERE